MSAPAPHGSGDLSPARLALALVGIVALLTFYYGITEGPGRINHDMSEAYIWGREFQWGYHQHPPFWAWICGVWFLVFPHEIVWFGLLSAVNAALGLLGVWLTTGFFLTGPRRTAALALAAITPCFSLLAFKYNANIIFISLWPWTLYFFLRSLEHRRLIDALGFGAFAGFCLLSKYYALVLLGSCLLASWLPERRAAYWRSASPYVSMLVALALFSPHVVWLIENLAPPLKYLASQSGLDASDLTAFLANTAVGALAIAAPAAMAVAAFAHLHERAPPENPSRFRLLAVLAVAPIALTFLAALILRTRLYTEMLVGVFPLWPAFCVVIGKPAEGPRFERYATRLALSLAALLGLLAVPVSYVAATRSTRADSMAPLRDVSLAAERAWREMTSAPLVYVAGETAAAQAAAFYSADRPHAFANFDLALSPWIDPAALAKDGFLAICPAEAADCREKAEHWAGPRAKSLDLELSHVAWFHVASSRRYHIVISPPAPPDKTTSTLF